MHELRVCLQLRPTHGACSPFLRPDLRRRWILAIWLSLLAWALPACAWAQEGRRVAMLIGNAGYAVGRLTNPPNDVKEMAAALRALGFKVMDPVLDGDQKRMKRALREFGAQAQGADVALLYYSGHAAQAAGENWLLPVGASIEKEADYEVEAVAASAVMGQIAAARPKVGIVVLDACRDNPLAAVTKSGRKGLGRMDVPTGTLIAYATEPNNTAGDEGHYARVLAAQLRTPGLELIDVFRNTTAEVSRLTKGRQVPRISEVSITDRVYLAGLPVVVPPVQVATVRPVPEPVATVRSEQPPRPNSPADNSEYAGRPGYYTIKAGDTLLRVAIETGQNWRDIRRWNDLDFAHVLQVGEVLRVWPPDQEPPAATHPPAALVPDAPSQTQAGSGSVEAAVSLIAPTQTSTTGLESSARQPAAAVSVVPGSADDLGWIWPAKGAVVAPFDEGKTKGLLIGGNAGDPVLAAADGRVVYAGSGIRGYGNLVLIKHNNTYLTTYAHNRTLLVREDQSVKRGQKIAEMGSTDAPQVQLLFEVRKQGRPINPLGVLPPR